MPHYVIPMDFQVLHRDPDTGARACRIVTSRGRVNTPLFMPVATRGAVRALSMFEFQALDFGMLLSNTYHLYLRPGLEVLRGAGGLHRFMNYERPVLTDSGGFQVFSLSDFRKIRDNGIEFRSHIDGSSHFFTPELVLDIQRVIGSDIMMVLDECIAYPAGEGAAKKAVERTVQWAVQSYRHWNSGFDTDRQDLFAIVQGSTFPELRRQCAESLGEHDFSGYAIGGLSVGEPKEEYRSITEYTLPLLPPEKPRYMMGVGSPMEILFAVRHGVDMFDCVMPTRIARNGALYTSGGRINIKGAKYGLDHGPLDEKCGCPVCKKFSRAYLHHLFRVGEISSLIYNTYHNLYFMKQFMEDIRISIEGGSFMKLYRKWDAVYGEQGR